MSQTTKTNRPAMNSRPAARSEQKCDMQPCNDMLEALTIIAREKPDVAALWCFGIGFVLGWKVKPW